MTVHAHPAALPTRGRRVLLHHRLADGITTYATPETASRVAFEHGKPIRAIPMYEDQKHTPGLYWSATNQALLAYESHLEAKWMTLLDFDPAVVAIAAQPFRIQALDVTGSFDHTPDLFMRMDDGTGRVIDVKNPNFVDAPDVLVQAERTRAICEQIGFGYQLVGEPDPVLWRNVRWLAGYRRPLPLPNGLTEQILRAAAIPIPFGALTGSFDVPELARTAALRACWLGQLAFDTSVPLRDSSLVYTTEQS